MVTSRRLALTGSVVAAALCLTACGSDDEPDSAGTGATTTATVTETPPATETAPPSETATSASAEAVTVEIQEHDGTIEPSGDTVEVERGQEIQFVVTSDVDDEIHVHSVPEHEFEVSAGADAEKLEPFTIDTPGTVEVESHELEVVIVKLQVS